MKLEGCNQKELKEIGAPLTTKKGDCAFVRVDFNSKRKSKHNYPPHVHLIKAHNTIIRLAARLCMIGLSLVDPLVVFWSELQTLEPKVMYFLNYYEFYD